MNKSILSAMPRLLGALLPLIPVTGYAQTDASPANLPELKDPVIPRMPAHSAWVVTYGQKSQQVEVAEGGEGAANASTTASSVQATITKSGAIYRITYAQPVAGYREIWSSNGVTLAINSTRTRAALVSSVLFPLTDFTRSDFDDFSWVNKSTFKEVREVKNQKLLLFQVDSLKRQLTARDAFLISQMTHNNEMEQIGLQLENPDEQNTQKEIKPLLKEKIIRNLGWDNITVALIDSESHRPLLLTSGDYQVSVAYLGTSVNLVPPALVLERLAKEKDRAKAFNSANSRPRP
jgi:hypothetical protein